MVMTNFDCEELNFMKQAFLAMLCLIVKILAKLKSSIN